MFLNLATLGSMQEGAARTNIQAQADLFVGRERTLAKLRRTLREGARVVSLHGQEGVGKSRAAHRYGTIYLNDFLLRGGEGVWTVSLEDARGLDGFLRAINETFNLAIPQDFHETPSVAVGRLLAQRGRRLVILNDCDHVRDAARQALDEWSEICPQVQFLVTSREPLGVLDEIEILVTPLRVPPKDRPTPDTIAVAEATVLFVDRAREVLRGYTPSDRDYVAISQIVRQLGGLPLAIELAAARVASLTPPELLERLPRKVDLLKKSKKDRPKSKRVSLSGTIEWSWDLLRDWERSALAQASVFRGGFDAAAAAAVIDLGDHIDAPTVDDALQSLVVKSLLKVGRVEGSMHDLRYSHYPSVRDFAEDHLRQSGQSKAYDRHARYFIDSAVALAARVDERGGQAARQLLEMEADNLLAVTRRALSSEPATAHSISQALEALLGLEPVLTTRGPFAVHLELLTRALEPAEVVGVDPLLRARARESRGRVLRARGDMAASLDDLNEALRLARECGDLVAEGRALANIGTHYLDVGNLADAASFYREGLTALREANATVIVGRAVAYFGLLHQQEGRLDEAHRCFDEGLEVHRRVGDKRYEGITRGNFGALLLERGRIDDARRELLRALQIHRAVKNRRYEGRVLAVLGRLEFEQHRLEPARTHVEKALLLHREVLDRRGEGMALMRLGDIALDGGRLELAKERYEASLLVHREVGNRRAVGLSVARLGATAAARLDVATAERLLDEAVTILSPFDDPLLQEALRLYRGHVDHARGAIAARAGDEDTQRAWQARTQKLVNRALGPPSQEGVTTPLADRSDEVRSAVRTLLSVGGGPAR